MFVYRLTAFVCIGSTFCSQIVLLAVYSATLAFNSHSRIPDCEMILAVRWFSPCFVAKQYILQQKCLKKLIGSCPHTSGRRGSRWLEKNPCGWPLTWGIQSLKERERLILSVTVHSTTDRQRQTTAVYSSASLLIVPSIIDKGAYKFGKMKFPEFSRFSRPFE